LNVTVSAALLVATALHGFAVPEHVELLRFDALLHPAKVEPEPGAAENVTVALLLDVVKLGVQVLVTVCELLSVPVPPHETGALTVPTFGEIVTEPLPIPAKFRVQFRGHNIGHGLNSAVSVTIGSDAHYYYGWCFQNGYGSGDLHTFGGGVLNRVIHGDVGHAHLVGGESQQSRLFSFRPGVYAG
jgi:hypothetical protein